MLVNLGVNNGILMNSVAYCATSAHTIALQMSLRYVPLPG